MTAPMTREELLELLRKHIQLDWLSASDGHPDIVGFGDAADAILDHGSAQRPVTQETRGDEPVAHMTYNSIKAAFVEYHKTMTVMDEPASFDSYSQGYVAGWNAKEAAPQQSGVRGDEPVAWRLLMGDGDWAYHSGPKPTLLAWEDLYAVPQKSPRLERDKLLIDQRLTVFAENAAKRIARAEQLDNVSAKEIYRTIIEAMVSGCIALQTAQDADALLSPDTTVVSSTNRAPLPSESLYTPEEAEPHIEGES